MSPRSLAPRLTATLTAAPALRGARPWTACVVSDPGRQGTDLAAPPSAELEMPRRATVSCVRIPPSPPVSCLRTSGRLLQDIVDRPAPAERLVAAASRSASQARCPRSYLQPT